MIVIKPSEYINPSHHHPWKARFCLDHCVCHLCFETHTNSPLPRVSCCESECHLKGQPAQAGFLGYNRQFQGNAGSGWAMIESARSC